MTQLQGSQVQIPTFRVTKRVYWNFEYQQKTTTAAAIKLTFSKAEKLNKYKKVFGIYKFLLLGAASQH